MANKRGKTHDRGTIEAGISECDRLSKLPDPLIHHILSFVHTVDAVRTSLLSRRWRRVWYSVPTLRFCEFTDFKESEDFEVFVKNCLMHRCNAARYIADSAPITMVLDVYLRQERYDVVTKWLNFRVIMNNVKKLYLGFRNSDCFTNTCYFLPYAVMNSRSLTRLVLRDDIQIGISCSVDLPRLKHLVMIGVDFHTEFMSYFLKGCPLLEELVLIDAGGRDQLSISSSSLKSLEVDSDCIKVVVEAANLESAVLSTTNLDSVFHFSACSSIRDLSISPVSEEFCSRFEEQISKLALLERLTLTLGNDIGEMKISNTKLKHFCVHNFFGQEFKLTTDTPNLVSFLYRGTMKLSVSMKDPNRRLKGQFVIHLDSPDQLMTFLSRNDCSWNSLVLYVKQDQVFILPKELEKASNRPEWPNLKHMKVMILEKLTRRSEARKSLEWLFPCLETLSIEKDHNTFTEPLAKFGHCYELEICSFPG